MDFTDPKTGDVWKSEAISANGSAWHVYSLIKGFFTHWQRWGSDINVDRVMYDADNAVTENSDDAVKYVYNVELKKRIDGYSFTAYNTATYGNIASTITINPPNGASGTQSSMPLAGNFQVKCPDENGVFHTSREMDIY